jgi:hypothetical protein
MEKRERRDGGFGMEMMERRGGGFAMEKRERRDGGFGMEMRERRGGGFAGLGSSAVAHHAVRSLPCGPGPTCHLHYSTIQYCRGSQPGFAVEKRERSMQ